MDDKRATQLERNKSILRKYIPEPTVGVVAAWIYDYDFKLKIKKGRTTKYGDYRPPLKGKNHQISINNNLNSYAFLLTLVHEIAHLRNWNRHEAKVNPHGKEWKEEFKSLMKPFLEARIFPEDVHRAFLKYLANPAASSCSDLHMQRILKKYDNGRQAVTHLEELPTGTIFRFGKGKLFRKGPRVRTRFLCKEVRSNREYYFNALTEVECEKE
jgi:SprT protein